MAKNQKQRLPSSAAPISVAPPPGNRGSAWRSHLWRLLAIWGLVLAAYSNSFHGALLFDSATAIGQDPRIRQATAENVGAILHGGYWYFDATAGLYRPLTTFSYLLNYAVFGNGLNPAGYHLVNFLIHEVNVTLVYALGLLVLGGTVPALALAAIWGLHPLLTESVTNIVGRADLLAALGVLSGFLCFLKGREAGRHRMTWLAGLAGAQTVAIFSKESGAVLIGIMLLYDLIWPQRTNWRRRAEAYAVVAVPLAVFFLLRTGPGSHMAIAFSDNPLTGAGFWTARFTAVKVIGKYLWLFLWPARLSADYSYNAVPLFRWRLSDWEDVKAVFALAAVAGAAIVVLLPAVRKRATGKLPLFFLGFFFLALLPVSNLIILIGSIMAERFLYLPAVGLAGFAVASVCALGRVSFIQRRAGAPVAWGALGLVCIGLAGRTYARNFDWQDGVSLWTSAAEVSPGNSKSHYNLAKELEQIPGRMPDAVAQYREAVRIEPNRADAQDNLANALASVPGGLAEAIDHYGEALRIEPGSAAVHNDLGNALARLPGRIPDAIAEYKTALRIEPGNAEVHYNLAIALSRTPGSLPEAIDEYRAALRIQPDHADAHNNLGNALSGIPGRGAEAIDEYKEALRIQPDLVSARINLGNALLAIPDRAPEAIAEYRAALKVQPDSPEAHYSLGIALAGIPGRLPEAITEFQAALRFQPDFFEAHVTLGKALASTPGRMPEAIAEYEAALRIRPDPLLLRTVDRLRAGH